MRLSRSGPSRASGCPWQKPVHGSIGPAELRWLGLKAKDVIDFSANINPLGVSSLVSRAAAEADAARYPDPDCLDLRQALSRSTGVAVASILVGNGSTELIHLLARACLAAGDRAVVLAPTFGEYEAACRLAGVEPAFLRSEEERGFRWDVPAVCAEIKRVRPRLVFLCNPNNPTGLYLDRQSVMEIAKATAPGVLAVDEAYLPFADAPWDSLSLLELGNVVLLRSMTKDHGLAGLRLGYALAPRQVGAVEAMGLCQPSWSVNSMAQAAGLAALSHPEHVSRAREVVAEANAYLCAALADMGLRARPSSANFLLVKAGDAAAVRAALLKRGLCVRDCTSFGLPQHIRLAARPLPDCRRLVEGLKEVLSGQMVPGASRQD